MSLKSQSENTAGAPGTCCRSDAKRTSRRVLQLQTVTLAWMTVECGLALWASWRASSAALLAFGSDSFVELLSAIVVLLQFAPSFSISEDKASSFAGLLLYLLAAVVTATSICALLFGIRPETSPIGIGVTSAALLIMPLLGWAKRKAAREIGNTALAADAVQSATCAYLAAITLAGLAINAIFHVGWVDTVAALAIVPLLCIEGHRAWRGEACGCC